MGQPWPASTCDAGRRARRAPRARPAAARARAGRAARAATARRMSVVPGGMELDLVDAVAEAVVRAQDRRVLRSPARPRRMRLAARDARRARRARSRAQPRPRARAPPRARGPSRRDCSPRAAAAGSAPRGSAAWGKSSRRPAARANVRRRRKHDGLPGCPGSPSIMGGSSARQSGTRRSATAGQTWTQVLNAWRQAWKPGRAASRASSRQTNATAWAWSMHASSPLHSAMAACLVALQAAIAASSVACTGALHAWRSARHSSTQSWSRLRQASFAIWKSSRHSAPHGLRVVLRLAACTVFGSIDRPVSRRTRARGRSGTPSDRPSARACCLRAPGRDTGRRRAARCRCMVTRVGVRRVEHLAGGDGGFLVGVAGVDLRVEAGGVAAVGALLAARVDAHVVLVAAGVLRGLVRLLAVGLALPVLARRRLDALADVPGPCLGGERSGEWRARVTIEVRCRAMSGSPLRGVPLTGRRP